MQPVLHEDCEHQTISIRDVRRVAQQYLQPDKLIILAVGPPEVREKLGQCGKAVEIELQ